MQEPPEEEQAQNLGYVMKHGHDGSASEAERNEAEHAQNEDE
jgi:hypothetical protein